MRRTNLSCAVRSSEIGRDGALRALRRFFPGSRVEGLSHDGRFPEVDLTFHLLDGAILTRGEVQSVRFSDGEGPSGPHSRLRLFFPQDGALEGEACGRPLSFTPGDVGLIDGSQPFEILADRCAHIEVAVSRSCLTDALPAFAGFHGQVLRSPIGRLLVDHVASLGRHVTAMAGDEVRSVTRATLGLIAAGLGNSAQRIPAALAGVKPAIRLDVERYIDGRLSSPALLPDAIARDLQIPRSTLFKAFAPLGGVSSFVQARRLDTARALLAHPEERRPIGEIAEALGFGRAATFSKAFHRRFGCSPRQARQGEGGDVANVEVVFDRWRAIVAEELRARGRGEQSAISG